MSGHTPGPWRVAADGFEVTTAPVGILTSSGRICDTSTYYKPEAEAQANARVIAAAPDLLAVLIELTDIEGPLPGNAAWHARATAAITKATGAA